MKLRAVIFEKVNKIDKHFAKLMKEKKREDSDKIRNERGDVTTDATEKQRIMRYYCEK